MFHSGKATERTVWIQEAPASGYYTRVRTKSKLADHYPSRILTSQTDTPASVEKYSSVNLQLQKKNRWNSLHPFPTAVPKQPAKVDGLIYPLLASAVVAGFPMTILFSVTPAAAIWKTDVLGQVEEEAVRRPVQVTYSLTPSVTMVVEYQTCSAQSRKLTVVKLIAHTTIGFRVFFNDQKN
jgi:hypothetical protein